VRPLNPKPYQGYQGVKELPLFKGYPESKRDPEL